MENINKLKKQQQRADLASNCKEFIKNVKLNNITDDYLKRRINTLLVIKKIIDKPAIETAHQAY